MKDPYQIIKRPVITEKSTWLKELNREICFEVDSRANKIEISETVEKLFKVKVVDVRVMNVVGKKKRVGRILGKKRNWKKAIVTLAPGNSIEIFAGV